MRTASATYPLMVPQIAQQWQADAASGATEAPDTAQGVGTEAQGEATEASFDDVFSQLTTPEPETKKKDDEAAAAAAAAPAAEEGGGLPAVGADGKPVPVVAAQETPEAKAAREAAASGQETPEAKAAREAAAAAAPAAPAAPVKDDTDAIMKALRGIMEAKPEPAPAAAPVEEPTYTAEQQALVDAHMAEWPEVAVAQEIIRAAEYKQLTRYIFGQIAPLLQQVMGTTTQVAAVSHEQQLHQLVPDYAQVREPVVAWIATQPAFLRPAYEAVAANGTAAQVAEVIDAWRTATGTAKPAPVAAAAPAPAPAPKPAPKPAPAPPAAVAALAPVRAARASIPQTGIDPTDFDAAFSEHAKAMASAM